MDIRFKGASLHYYERTLNTAVAQEDTLEMIVPDALPDASELLLTDGHSLIRGKDVHRSGVAVSGLSELTVLYRAEDGSLGRLPADIPFETEISFNVSDDAARVVSSVRLISGEARILNSRKLLLRAEVCITVSVWTPRELRWAAQAEPEGCSVELKTEKSLLRNVCAVEEKTFNAEDTLSLSAGKPRAEEILYARAALGGEEAEQVGRKLVVRGLAAVTAVYRTAAEEIAAADFRLPWSAFLELPEEGGDFSYELVTALTGCSAELTDGGFTIAVGGVAQAAIRRESEVCWIADAYGTDCVFTPVFESAAMDTEAVCEQRTETVTLRLDSMKKPRSIAYLTADCGKPRQEKDSVRVPVTAKALCVMDGGELELLSGRGEAVCAGCGSVPEVSCGEVFAAVTAGGVEVRSPVSFRRTGVRSRVLSFLTGGEAAQLPERPSGPNVVLLRASEGDSVWSLGKKKGISCAAIRSYNQLSEGEEPAPGTLLLLAR